MSYDLIVFEPSMAPRSRDEFRAWVRGQMEWAEGHDYNDPAVPSEALQRWYRALIRHFPDMNVPELSETDDIGPEFTEYSLGSNVIYAAFAWTEAEKAYDTVRRLAVEHDVGFYDVSGDEGDGEIYFPGDTLRPPSGGQWRQVAKQFRDLKGNR